MEASVVAMDVISVVVYYFVERKVCMCSLQQREEHREREYCRG